MTTLLGIVNITEDSFSDGGRYLDSAAALLHARALAKDGADILDLGAASSNVEAKPVSTKIEIARLAPVVAALKVDGFPISIDSFAPDVQRWALAQDVDYLNDIQGFPHKELYPDLAASRAKLIVMHSVQGLGRATRDDVPASEIFQRVVVFFEMRLEALEKAGIGRTRMILDPGMGFFLGGHSETSFEILRRLTELKTRFGLPLLVSVSRKSFLRAATGRSADKAGPASLAAEIFAISQGADYIRTHAPGPVRDAMQVQQAIGRDTATKRNAT